MTARGVRCITLVWATILLGSCDTNPIGPGADDLSLAANPGNPLNLIAAPGSPTHINLEWDDMSPREDGFEVYRSTTGIAGSFGLRLTFEQPNVTTASDFGLEPVTEYCYKVRSFRFLGKTNKAYSGFSNTDCETTPDVPPPTAPTALYAIPLGSTVVQVGWTDNSANETGFRLERSNNPAGPWVQATSTPYAPFYDTGLERDQQVCYRVVAYLVIAVNTERVSTPSNVACTAPPAAPTLTATAVTTPATGILLTWTQSAVADGYDLRRWVDYYCYDYYYYCGGDYVSIAIINDPTQTSYLDANVLPGEYHYYYIVARKDGGQSDPSFASASISP